jgi:hypothetical protein
VVASSWRYSVKEVSVLESDAHAAGGPIPNGHKDRNTKRLRRAAWAYTTRRVPHSAAHYILKDAPAPQAGDLVLARVNALGYHTGLQLPDGRRKHLFAGDEIVVVYGNRYAPSQFEAVVPKTLGPCHLVAGGGVAAKALSWHARVKDPTQITPIGLVADAAGQVLNLRDFALQAAGALQGPCPPTVAVVGTAMDSGKTQTAAYLVKGLTLAGYRVGYAKITGTGAGGDTWLLKDAGANPVVDFTDAGFVSTYLASPADIESVFKTLMAHLTRAGVGAAVLEVADGVLQSETATLLESPLFNQTVNGLLFAANDAMGAVAGSEWLRTRSLPIVGISGVLTASPLQCEESAKATGLPAYSRSDLARARTAKKVLRGARPSSAWHSEPTRSDRR